MQSSRSFVVGLVVFKDVTKFYYRSNERKPELTNNEKLIEWEKYTKDTLYKSLSAITMNRCKVDWTIFG